VISVVIVGIKHTGKSGAARAIGQRFDRPVVDTDTLIQELDATEAGLRRPVRDIYRDDGVARFRQLELTACRLAVERNDGPVISTGGGVCDNAEAVALFEHHLVVHLVDSYERLVTRVLRNGIPPFLQTSDIGVARKRFKELYEMRIGKYEAMSTVSVDIRQLDIDTAHRRVCDVVEEYLHGWK
jgi:shikimate kinase